MALVPFCFKKTVASAGTAERLTNRDIYVPAVLIQGISTNGGDVYLGDEKVSSTNGIELDASDTIVLSAYQMGWADEKINLYRIWIDADSDDEGVNVMYMERVD
jgi:hypothetical protein